MKLTSHRWRQHTTTTHTRVICNVYLRRMSKTQQNGAKMMTTFVIWIERTGIIRNTSKHAVEYIRLWKLCLCVFVASYPLVSLSLSLSVSRTNSTRVCVDDHVRSSIWYFVDYFSARTRLLFVFVNIYSQRVVDRHFLCCTHWISHIEEKNECIANSMTHIETERYSWL